MRQEDPMKKKKPDRVLHGNQAHVDPNAQITSSLITQVLSQQQEEDSHLISNQQDRASDKQKN